MKHSDFLVRPGMKLRLKDYDPDFTGGLTKEEALRGTVVNGKKIRKLQNILHSMRTYAVLYEFVGTDGSGKDSAIDHVLLEVNAMGLDVTPSGVPSDLELDHDFMWRHVVPLPRRGMIGANNRNYLEEVVTVRVHPEILQRQRLPKHLKKRGIWKRRFEGIRNIKKFWADNGLLSVTFFLYITKREQAKRFLKRQNKPSKRVKFSLHDVKERAFFSPLMRAYEDALPNTSIPEAPNYIIPGNHKWFAHYLISEIIVHHLEKICHGYPELTPERRLEFAQARKILKKEISKKN